MGPVDVTPKWLTPPAIIAVENINKELTPEGNFKPTRPIYNDSFGKRQIDGKSRIFANLTGH
jgi:hypothetical protein